MKRKAWHFCIDRGGTFTDVLGRAPEGTMHALKVLTEPGDRRDAAVHGVRRLMGLSRNEIIPAGSIGEVRIGTSLAVNALAGRSGPRTALIITKGFGDSLRIGCQGRAALLAPQLAMPDQLYCRVAEINERVLACGTVERPLDIDEACAALESVEADGCTSVAIVFMHGRRYPAHEARVAAIARDMFFPHVSVSHEAAPAHLALAARARATVADAYFSTVLHRFAARLVEELDPDRTGARLLFLTPSGGLTGASAIRAGEVMLSGPSGGLLAMAQTGAAAGFGKIASLDMGGTSARCARLGGGDAPAIPGVRPAVPVTRLELAAVGGGSILRHEGGVFRVGPESAGASPGPACFGCGGPLTLTDANAVAGRLVPESFPAVFGASGREALDLAAARAQFEALARETGQGLAAEEMAEAFLETAAAALADAVRAVTVADGYNLEGHVLNAGGSASGQHACRLADALGVTTVMFHPRSGVASAYGLALAETRAVRRKRLDMPLGETVLDEITAAAAALGAEARAEVRDAGVSALAMAMRVFLAVRYAGTEEELDVLAFSAGGVAAAAMAPELMSLPVIKGAFEAAHAARFGFIEPERELMAVAVTVEVTETRPGAPSPRRSAVGAGLPAVHRMSHLFSAGAWHDAALYRREQLRPGHAVDGPALLIGEHQTIVVEKGWRAQVSERDDIILDRAAASARSGGPDAVDVFNNRLAAIAADMGNAPQAASLSAGNRGDFACAIVDAGGGLMAHSPHSPVHTASMDSAVAAIIRGNSIVRPGDVFAINAPYGGGVGAAYVTVCMPVFDAEGGAPPFWVAVRGHHAGIEGLAPEPRSVEDEGPAIYNFRLVDRGVFREADFVALLLGGRYPPRGITETVALHKAQVAAAARGARGLRRLIAEAGAQAVAATAARAQNAAAARVRRAIAGLADRTFACPVDNGGVIHLRITVDRERGEATADFTGTSPQRPDSFNAPPAVTRAAVMYAVRMLPGGDFPMNAGCLRPVRIIVPEGTILSPRWPAPVGDGAGEVAQAVANCLFRALGMEPGGHVTSASATLSNRRAHVFEALGPCPGVAWPAMTAASLSDPEELETCCPLVVENCHILPGGGGARAEGGLSRTIRVRERMDCVVSGRTTVHRRDGSAEEPPGRARTVLEAGDAITIVARPGPS